MTLVRFVKMDREARHEEKDWKFFFTFDEEW
jgi:hypothetical protein